MKGIKAIRITADEHASAYLDGHDRVRLATELILSAKAEAAARWGFKLARVRWLPSVQFLGTTAVVTFITQTTASLTFYVDRYGLDGDILAYRVELAP